jgi:hypothetical protein
MTKLTRIDFDKNENPETVTLTMAVHDAERVTRFLVAQHFGAQTHPHMISALNDLIATVANIAASPDTEITIARTASQAAWTATFFGSWSKYLAGQPTYAEAVATVDHATQEAISDLWGVLVGALNPFAENDYMEFAR